MYENVKFIYGGLFSSRGSWKHSERCIETNEIIAVTEGEAHMFVGDREYTLSQGDVLIIPAGVVHGGSRTSEKKVSFFWIHFTSDKQISPEKILVRPKRIYQVYLICKELLHYASTPDYPTDCADLLTRLLLIELYEDRASNSNCDNRICAQIREWIRANADLPLKASDVSDHFGYNGDYLCRTFKQHVGCAIKEYIDKTKLQRIKNDLANTSLTLQQIASKYSFESYKYFLKYFKYHEGITPTSYRDVYYNAHTNNQ